MSDKDFKVKNKLTIAGLTNSSGVLLVEGHTVDSHTNLATQYGGTGTTTSPSSGQILYSSSGTTYAPTALTSLDVKGASYSADAPSSPVVGQIWVESDSSVTPFDSNIIRRQAFTSTAGQTVYTTNIAFIDGYEQVFFNGMLLLRTTDYTTSNSNTVTLTAAAAVNDIVEVVTVTNLNSVNTYTQGEIDTALSAKLSTSTAASTYLTQSNASSTYLTPGTAASTYLSQSNAATTYVPQTSYSVAGKNALINGGMDIFQRGSFSSTSSAYALDRWKVAVGGSASATTVTQQTTGAPSGSRYSMRIASGASGGYGTPIQAIETNNTVLLQGKTVVLSALLRRNATYNGSVVVKISKNSTVDADPFGAGWSAISSVTVANGSMPTGTGSTDWYLVTLTAAIPNDGTANTVYVEFGGSVASSGAYWELAQTQLEVGSVATPFSRAGGTLQGELAACQRYYWRNSGAVYNPMGPAGYTTASTSANGYMILPVTMRVTPTSVDFANLTWRQINALGYTVTGITLSSVSTNKVIRADVAVSGGGMTSNIWGFLETDGYLNGVFGISAEL